MSFKVLVVDDEPGIRRVVRGVLEKASCVVLEAENSSEALGIMGAPGAPELAVIDWMMPGMSGLELVVRMRREERGRRPYLIMLTARSSRDDIVSGLESGADDFLAKPFDPEELAARVKAGLRVLEMQRRLCETRRVLEYQATHDQLTGLLNRMAIIGLMEREFSRESRFGEGLAVAICDIDHFKQVNDSFGHLVGDEVLRKISLRLKSGLRDDDAIGRYGGEEFLVVAPGAGRAGAEKLFRRLRESVCSSPVPSKSGPVPVTVSIGVKVRGKEAGVDEVINAADQALYRAKKDGRNLIRFA